MILLHSDMAKLSRSMAFNFLMTCLALFIGAVAAHANADEKTVSKKEVKKIIALSPHSVEMLYLLGVGEKIVGTTDFADYPEAAKDIPRIGGFNGIQIESVLALDPDLIIAWQGGNSANDVERLRSMGFKIFESETKKLGDIVVELSRLGALVGKPERAAELADAFTKRLSEYRQAHSQKASISFFYQLWSNPLRTMAAGSWINEMLTICGGENIFNDPALDYPQVSLEHILQKQPEIIVIPSHHGSDEGSAELWKGWEEIPAVKNKQIYHVNGDLLHRYSYRVLEGIEEVCNAMDKARADKQKMVN